MTKQEKAMKECPYCWEEILETAKKCKHCWEFLDDELRAEKEWKEVKETSSTSIWNYSWCWIIKRWLFEWTPEIICPKCWYKWKAKYVSWSYSWCLFIILLFLAIIPWLLYYAFSNWWKFLCPQCWEDHLKKTWSAWPNVFLIIMSIFAVFVLVVALASSNWDRTTRQQSQVEQNEVPTISRVVNDRINYVYENFWPNGIEKRDEFESMECVWDCSVADVELKLNANPKDLDVDTIARWQTLNLARELKKQIWSDIEAYCTVYVKGVKKEKCKWLWSTIDFNFWNNGCETY